MQNEDMKYAENCTRHSKKGFRQRLPTGNSRLSNMAVVVGGVLLAKCTICSPSHNEFEFLLLSLP